jgi:hypothetical protein
MVKRKSVALLFCHTSYGLSKRLEVLTRRHGVTSHNYGNTLDA